MSFDNTSLEQLAELYNLITDDNISVNETLSAYDNNEEQLREDLINNITDELLDNYNYDGDYEDFNAIYWFVKGVKSIPNPPLKLNPPKRYDQSDEFIRRKNKRLDDELFNDIKQKHKNKDVVAHRAVDEILHEYHKHRAQTKFNYNLNKEAITIQASKANYQRMLNEMLNSKPLLRPLPPAVMKELKPYHQKIFEGENQLFIDWISKFGHEFVNKADDQLLVDVPHDYDKALFLLNQHRSRYPNSQIVNKKQTGEPFAVYYLNKIACLNDIFNYLDNVVFKNERKPFKLEFKLSGIFETPIKQNDEVLRYDYDDREIAYQRYDKITNIPIIIQLNADLDKVKYYIESVLHGHTTSESSTLLTFVSSIAFTVNRLFKVSGKLSLPIELIKSNLIIVDNVDDKLCWYRFLAVCLNHKLCETKKYNINNRTNYANRLLAEEHGHPYKTHMTKQAKAIIDNFNGMTEDEMKDSAKCTKSMLTFTNIIRINAFMILMLNGSLMTIIQHSVLYFILLKTSFM